MISARNAAILNRLPRPIGLFLSRSLLKGYLRKYADLHIEGTEYLEQITSPCIFVCNHLSNSDAVVLDQVLKKIKPTFVAGVKLSKNAVTNMGIHAVKTTNIEPNTADKDGLRRIIDLIKQGESILIFPEGTRSRTGSLIEAKRGILLIARKTGVPIVPIGMSGTEKLLPIDPDGEMSAETFHHAKVEVRIGEQFELPKLQEGQSRKEYDTTAINLIMQQIARLLPLQYRGVYNETLNDI